MAVDGQRRAGVLCGVAAYVLWGLVPLFWPLLRPASATEILAHRMVWSLAVVGGALLVKRRWGWLRELAHQPRRAGLVALAATLVSVNWGFYIWGVNSGRVVESALGYFINPLVTICFGVLVLRERLRTAQWVAVGVGVLAVAVLTAGYGRLPWLALVLAFSFGGYGLVKKKIGLGGLESLGAETAVLFLPALVYLVVLGMDGRSTFTGHGAGHPLLLAAAGLVTAVPLVFFGAAALRVPLTTLGLLQYLAPVLQFLCGLLYFHETMPPERWAGFALVWLALALLTWDALRTARAGRSGVRASGGVVAGGVAAGGAVLPGDGAGAGGAVLQGAGAGAGGAVADGGVIDAGAGAGGAVAAPVVRDGSVDEDGGHKVNR
ncbi:EamA family transporter RarD [Streptomyces sp. SL13]|uniref:EamA family transporter RarD n=1 Tax=Streptantibioticus silvisoli TaxID=2705255 RepID=A0AA90KBN2_9ACTN|nr:EamA family transporter RarD [Streptantibioticus silvisoli]MDI5973903.1 EamA family transporter RarD [Streptantibioticus silvisoli]